VNLKLNIPAIIRLAYFFAYNGGHLAPQFTRRSNFQRIQKNVTQMLHFLTSLFCTMKKLSIPECRIF